MSSYGIRSQYGRFNAIGNSEAFPDPFNDVASAAMPDNWRNALQWCEFVYSLFGTYRMAMERIISYFLTDIEIGGDNVSEEEKDKYEDFLGNTLDTFTVLQNMLRDRMCFHGDVKAVTRDGVFKLRDLVGKTVDVLSQGGIYRPATFKSFGRQELLEVEFSDGRTILATPEHQWKILNCSGKEVVVETKDLKRRHRIKRTVAPRPERNADFREGVRHGFVFGDGYQSSKNRTTAQFIGDKDAELLEYFEGCGCPPRSNASGTLIGGLPGNYKQLPSNEASASYWYGFVCGFLAADGSVDVYGCALLTQVSKATLEAITAQLPRIGMCAGPVRAQRRITDLRKYNGNENAVYGSTIHYVTLLKRFMQPQDFLLSKHRQNFEKHFDQQSKYGEYVHVRAVRETGIVDEVFCCVEMETHTFVVDQALLSSNCYGNGFASLIVPFKRFLLCPSKGCGSLFPLREVHRNKNAFHFEWSNFQFIATCPKCGKRAPWKLVDKPDDEEKKIRIKRWSPHEIELLHDPYTDDVAYIWRIPEDYKKLVKDGNLFHLERASEQVLKAIQNNQVFRFNQDVVFHMKEPTLAGIRNRGWGLPRIFSNFRQIYYVQVLRRFNEAIALDYVIPFRLITPQPRPGSSGGPGGMVMNEPLANFHGGDFRSQVLQMIRKRRRDPAGWHVLPYPVQYQILGGDASNLAPRDLLDQGLETLLNDAGTPVELYKGSLQLQTAPVALRLFESTWHHLVHDTNMFLQWLVRQISQIMSWEVVEARLKRVTIADDMNKQMAALQLMMVQQLSGRSGLAAVGYDWDSEQKRLAEEARKQQEIQARMQEEMEQAGFAQQIAKGQAGGPMPAGGAGGAPGGAAPGGAGGGAAGADPNAAAGGAAAGGMAPGMGGSPVTQYVQSMGPNVPVTPNDLMATADQLAQELLGLPEGVKDSELRKLKQYNEVLHSLVRAKMDAIRQQARTQGGAAMMQQQFGGGGMPPAA